MENKVILKAASHVLLTSDDVPKITKFFSELFGIAPYFENEQFAEFVLPSRFRVAFFKPVGTSARFFKSDSDRSSSAIGLTVDDVEACYKQAETSAKAGDLILSGPPKEHPWGEKSFLLVDPQGNRWEIAQSPSADGLLVNR